MTDGKLRIKTAFDNTGARKDAKEFEKLAYDTAKNASDNDAKIDFDVSQAEKELKRIENEISKYQKKLNELENGKLGKFNAEKLDIQASTDKELMQTATDEQAARVLEMEKVTLEQLENKYKSVVSQAKEYTNQIENAQQKQAELKNQIEQAEEAQKQASESQSEGTTLNVSGGKQLVESLEGAQDKFNSIIRNSNSLTSVLNGGVKVALDSISNTSLLIILKMVMKIIEKVSEFCSDVLESAKKILNVVKNFVSYIGKKVLNSLKSIGSNLLGINKKSNILKNNLLQIGLALVGVKSLMSGLRSAVTSALNDNEKLQKQLNAIKGILGQALAPAINILVQGLSQMVMFADRLYQAFTGISLIAKYNASQSEKAAKSAKKQADQLASFDEANKLTDNNALNSNSDETEALFQTVDLSNWLSDIVNQIKNGDWAEAGKAIADGINSALTKINWSGIQNKVNSFCKNLGDAVNGFVSNLDWDNVGNTVGQGLNTVAGAINSFVDRVDWDDLGTGFAKGLNRAVSVIDGDALGKALSAKLKIATDALYGFINDFKFADLGKKIGNIVNGWFDNVSWEKIKSNISNGVNGIVTTFKKFVENLNKNSNISNAISNIINGFANIDFENAGVTIGKAINKLIEIAKKAIKKVDFAKLASNLADGFISILETIDWDDAGETIDEIFDSLTLAIETFFDKLSEDPELLGNVGNSIWKFLKGLGKLKFEFKWDMIGLKFTTAGEGFAKSLEEYGTWMEEHVNGWIDEQIENLKKWVKDKWEEFCDWLGRVDTWFEEGIDKLGNWLFKILGFDEEDESVDVEVNATMDGKTTVSFDKAKELWDSITDKWNTSELKGKLNETFTKAKEKWDSIKEKGKEAAATIKGKIADTFSKLKTKWDSIKEKGKTAAATIKGTVKDTFSKLKSKWDSIKKEKTSTIIAKAKDNATSVFKNIANNFIDFINRAIDKINSKLKISVGGTLSKVLSAIGVNVSNGSYQLFSIPKIPKLAKGGIAYNPGRGITATVGEGKYPEAILPLSDTVLGKLASMIGSQMSGANGQIIIPIYLDGRVIAKYVIDLQNKRAFALNKGGAY